MRSFAAFVARLMARTNSSAFGELAVSQFVRSSPRTTSTAMALAISPAAAPPMPSATMNSVPFGPTGWVWTSDSSVVLFVVRSATTNASSLCSRVCPTSVRPNTCTMISPVGREGVDVELIDEGSDTRTGGGSILRTGESVGHAVVHHLHLGGRQRTAHLLQLLTRALRLPVREKHV